MASGARRWPKSSYLSMRPGRMSAATMVGSSCSGWLVVIICAGGKGCREGVGLGRCEVQGKGAWRGRGVGASGRWSWAYQNAIRRVDNAVGCVTRCGFRHVESTHLVSTFVHAGRAKSS